MPNATVAWLEMSEKTFQLFFKHLYPSYQRWQEPPLAPWGFDGGVLFSTVSFFESPVLESGDVRLRDVLQCETFLDSGAFAADSMGFQLDPYEVAEMAALLEPDYVVPLDRIVFSDDSEEVVEQKIQETLKNTEILLDYKSSKSKVIGPLQGFSEDLIQHMIDEYKQLGVRMFGLGGLVFQEDLKAAFDRIRTVRRMTEGYWLHVFGKFLHPRLMRGIIEIGVNSVDGYGYILNSVRGLYIVGRRYVAVRDLTEQQLNDCSCHTCQENDVLSFQRGDEDAQYLLIMHNIHSLIRLRDFYMKSIKRR